MKLHPFLITVFLCAGLSGQDFSGSEDEILIWNGPGPGSDTLGITQEVTERLPRGDCSIDRAVEHVTETGIVPFIAAETTGAAVVICPGGGYSRLSIDKEGTDLAQWFNELGICAFVCKYRLPADPHLEKHYVPLQDAQRAMRYVRGHAGQWGIDPGKIGIMGASAGGHMAATLATKYALEVYDPIDSLDFLSARPDFMILLYPVVSMETGISHPETRTNLIGANPTPEQIEEFSAECHVNGELPVTFMARALDDYSVPEANSTRLRDSLTAAGVDNVLHQYTSGGHGKGICEAVGTDFARWVGDCGQWLYKKGYTNTLPVDYQTEH
jgi:acetyl esterase/lipase